MIENYLKTLCYYDVNGSKRIHVLRMITQIIIPIMGAIILHLLGVRLGQRENILTLISTVTGLMCTVAVLLFEVRTSTLRIDKLTTHQDESSVDELFYLCCWLIAIGILGSLFLFLPDLDYPVTIPSPLIDVYSVICIAFVLHFAMGMASFATRFARIYIRTAEHRD